MFREISDGLYKCGRCEQAFNAPSRPITCPRCEARRESFVDPFDCVHMGELAGSVTLRLCGGCETETAVFECEEKGKTTPLTNRAHNIASCLGCVSFSSY